MDEGLGLRFPRLEVQAVGIEVVDVGNCLLFPLLR
jgi:hypothetical protein